MTNFNPEIPGNNEEFNLEAEFEKYANLDQDDKDGCIEVGIPLYQHLKKIGDKRADDVKSFLLYLRDVLKSSGAGSKEGREALIKQINEGVE